MDMATAAAAMEALALGPGREAAREGLEAMTGATVVTVERAAMGTGPKVESATAEPAAMAVLEAGAKATAAMVALGAGEGRPKSKASTAEPVALAARQGLAAMVATAVPVVLVETAPCRARAAPPARAGTGSGRARATSRRDLDGWPPTPLRGES